MSPLHEDPSLDLAGYYAQLIEREYMSDGEVDPALDEDRFFGEAMSLAEMRAFLMNKGWTEERLQASFIQEAREEIAHGHQRLKELAAEEEAERLTRSRLPAMHAILDEGELTKLLRYEPAIERQLYRALAQLERLQRQRGGEPVPPPLQIEVNTSHDP
jgi:hypothetical protein